MRISRKQKAVYWGTPTPNGYGGFTYADPVEIDCRWEDKQELFAKSVEQQQLSVAVVYPDRDVDVNGRLMLGTLDDLESSWLPDDNNALIIQAVSKIPNVRVTDYLRKVWL